MSERVEAVIGALRFGIAKEDARLRFGIEFVSGVRTEPGVAETTKTAEFEIVGRGAKETVIWGTTLKSWSRKAIYEVGGCSKGIRRKGKRELGVREER